MEDPILEYRVLDAVQEHDGPLTQRHISQRIGWSVASVNFALRLLAVKGYIKVSGASPRNFRYHLTPTGILQKSVLAYNFMRRQSALYADVREGLLDTLKGLLAERVSKVSIYGWTPFTEAAMLYLISEGIRITALYVQKDDGVSRLNCIPVRLLRDFHADCEVLLLMEPLPSESEAKLGVRTLVCFPTDCSIRLWQLNRDR